VPVLDLLLALFERLLEFELQLLAIHGGDEDFIGSSGMYPKPLLAAAEAGDGIQHDVLTDGSEGSQNLATIRQVSGERINIENNCVQGSLLVQEKDFFRGIEKRNMKKGG
jgi:hypothetical protein